MHSIFVRIRKIFCLLLCLCPIDTWASSAEATNRTAVQTDKIESAIPAIKASNGLMANPELSGVSSWPLVIVMLLGIVGLILCLAWLAKRFGGFSAAGSANMRVVAAIPLGARERVALIDVNGQQFLLGVTAQNINHLHSFDEPVINLSNAPKGEFAKKLQTILKSQQAASDIRE